jgi:antitoxin (DNA-binding transcriptional repressor) of toxin-antitoxin stability system
MNALAPYLYELRRGEEIVATGHHTHEQPLENGERITIAGREGIVRSIIPIRGENQQRLIVQLLPTGDDP